MYPKGSQLSFKARMMSSTNDIESAQPTGSIYDVLPPDHTRILDLEGVCLSGDDSSGLQDLAIQCSLRTVSIVDVKAGIISYAALSYVWGLSLDPRPIVCNGHEMMVTKNLHDALRKMLRFKSRPRWLWVDAICINQGNNPERAQQVCLMQDIYLSAKIVIVWLGSGAAVSGGGFERYWRYIRNQDVAGLRTDPEACEQGARFFRGSSWMSRIWTLQEILLAKSAQVHCASFMVDWADFAACQAELGDQGCEEVVKLEETRATMAENPPTVHSLVKLSAGRAAKVPHDRMYGILGMYSGEWPGPLYYDGDAAKVMACATSIILQEEGHRGIGQVFAQLFGECGNRYLLDLEKEFVSDRRPQQIEPPRPMTWIPKWKNYFPIPDDYMIEPRNWEPDGHPGRRSLPYAWSIVCDIEDTNIFLRGYFLGYLTAEDLDLRETKREYLYPPACPYPYAIGPAPHPPKIDANYVYRRQLAALSVQCDSAKTSPNQPSNATVEPDLCLPLNRPETLSKRFSLTEATNPLRQAWICYVFGTRQLIAVEPKYDVAAGELKFVLVGMVDKYSILDNEFGDCLRDIFDSPNPFMPSLMEPGCTYNKAADALFYFQSVFELVGEIPDSYRSDFWPKFWYKEDRHCLDEYIPCF